MLQTLPTLFSSPTHILPLNNSPRKAGHAHPFFAPSMTASANRVPVRVQPVASPQQLMYALQVRRRVFIEEMGIPENEEFDQLDKWPVPVGTVHYLVTCNNQAIATCRVIRDGLCAKLERIAVDKNVRRRGIGCALLRHVEVMAIVQESTGPLYCYAMKDKELFYRNSGWAVEHGHGIVKDAGIPHVVMIKRRRPRGAPSYESTSLSHVMIRTKNISRARRFYSLLSYQDVTRFMTAGLKSAWIQSPYIDHRIELIEVGERDAPIENPVHPLSVVTPGLGHISIDLSRACTSLTTFLKTINTESIDRFGLALKVIQKPRQLMLGTTVAEVAFISDSDDTVIELMRFMKKLPEAEFDAAW